jgi:uncharacterized membrane protein
MKKILSFLKSKKQVGYVLITLLLVVLFVSLLTVKARQDNVVWQKSIGKETLCAGNQLGYDVTTNEKGNLIYTPTGADPQLYVLLNEGETFNKFTIQFAEPLSQATHVQLYYEADHTGLTEGNSSSLDLKAGEASATVFIPERNYTMLRLDVEGSFALEQLVLESVPLERYYTVNWLALALFVVSIVLLIVFDQKVGYVSSVISFFRNSWIKLKAEKEAHGYRRAALYLAMWVSTAIFIAVMAVLLLLSHLSVGAIFAVFAIGVIAVALQIAYRCISGEGNEPAKLFVVVALLLGFVFAYCLPITSGTAWDDQIHYQRAENISIMLLGHDSTHADYVLKSSPWLFSENFKNYDDLNTQLLLSSQSKTGEGYTLFNLYNCIPHMHMAFVIALRDLLGIDFILQMTLMKMANVLIYATVLYFGIKKLKSGAYLMSAICLMPTVIFAASVINYDFWVTAFLGYAMATFISELQTPERPLSLATTVKMLLAITVGCAPKAVYFILFLPILLLGKHKFKDGAYRKKYVIACCLVLALVLLSFALPFLVNTGSQTDVRGGADVNSSAQLSYILHNPLKYAKTLLYFMADYTSFVQASSHCSFYAYLNNPVSVCSTAVLLVILFCAFVDKGEADRFEKAGLYKLSMIASAFATIAIIATSLYIAFTAVGADWVSGCQWRYLIPVMFPLLYCLGTSKVTCRLEKAKMGAVVFGVLAAVLAISFFDVYISVLEF